MKKSSFVALILGTVSGMCFALGMCMSLLPEWNMLQTGVILGCIGLIIGLITVLVWRKMEKKPPIKLNKKTVGIILLATIGALILGTGMCLCLVWQNYLLGTIVGLVGIILLICLLPIIKGIKWLN